MRKTKEKLPCVALLECGKPSAKLGYCNGHYQQFKQGRPFVLLQPKGRNIGKLCEYGPCGLPATKLGYCSGHYQQIRGGRELSPLQDMGRTVQFICTFPGCTRPHEAHGYCTGHWQQNRAGKPLAPLQVMHSSCTFPGCGHPHEAQGYCYGHYIQFRRGKILQPLTDTPSPVEREGDSCRVTLFCTNQGQNGSIAGHAIISTRDTAIVEKLRWNLTSYGYARSSRRGASHGVLMHRLIMEVAPHEEVDHINGNRLDNRRENLRVVTDAQQSQNRKVRNDSYSGVRGVSYDAKKRLFRVTVTVNGIRYYGKRHKSKDIADITVSQLRSELMSHTNENREDIRKK